MKKKKSKTGQLEMFSARDVLQFGVDAHPQMDSGNAKLVLVSEDPRTEEEKERDRQVEAERRNDVLGL